MSFAVNHLVGFGAKRASTVAYGVSLSTNEELNRTPGSAGNRRKAAFSLWIKRSATGTTQQIFTAGTAATNLGSTRIGFDTSNRFTCIGGGATVYFVTNDTITDTTTWHHILFHWDNDNATSSLRVRIWLDGTECTLSTDGRASAATGLDYAWNSTAAHYLGRRGDSASEYLSADVARFHYFDGVLPAVSELYSGGVSVTYTGSYGTNGARLQFETAGDLGDDTSGNGNDWSLTNVDSSDQVTNGPA